MRASTKVQTVIIIAGCFIFLYSLVLPLLNDQQNEDDYPDDKADRHCHDAIWSNKTVISYLQDDHYQSVQTKGRDGDGEGKAVVSSR